jgi:hypothetical protein
VVKKIKVLFESEDDDKLFRESLQEFCLDKRISHIFKPSRFLNADESGKEIYCEICEVEDDLVENIEALIKKFRGKRFYSNPM